jgi:hypothetical protein
MNQRASQHLLVWQLLVAPGRKARCYVHHRSRRELSLSSSRGAYEYGTGQDGHGIEPQSLPAG